jgi:hypothetical protein
MNNGFRELCSQQVVEKIVHGTGSLGKSHPR